MAGWRMRARPIPFNCASVGWRRVGSPRRVSRCGPGPMARLTLPTRGDTAAQTAQHQPGHALVPARPSRPGYLPRACFAARRSTTTTTGLRLRIATGTPPATATTTAVSVLSPASPAWPERRGPRAALVRPGVSRLGLARLGPSVALAPAGAAARGYSSTEGACQWWRLTVRSCGSSSPRASCRFAGRGTMAVHCQIDAAKDGGKLEHT